MTVEHTHNTEADGLFIIVYVASNAIAVLCIMIWGIFMSQAHHYGVFDIIVHISRQSS